VALSTASPARAPRQTLREASERRERPVREGGATRIPRVQTPSLMHKRKNHFNSTSRIECLVKMIIYADPLLKESELLK